MKAWIVRQDMPLEQHRRSRLAPTPTPDDAGALPDAVMWMNVDSTAAD